MMKFLSILLLLLLFCCASCSESDPATPEVIRTDTYLSVSHTKDDMLIGGALEGFYMVAAFNRGDACDLSEETYATFEMYSDNGLRFISDWADADGTLHMTRDNIFMIDIPFSEMPDSYDIYMLLPVEAQAEGEYVFAVKFYQPKTGKKFITPLYRMRLQLIGNFVKVNMELLK